MKKRFLVFIIIMIVSAGAQQIRAEDASGAVNMKKVADDMKFSNAIEFFKLERYDRALAEFHEYLEIYYDGIHRSESYRKIAEIYIRKYNYQKAIEAYSSLYQEFSGTDEGIDAYFQAGVCYKKMGFDSKAEAIFRYIIENHQGTTAAYNSEIQLDLLKMENE